MDLELLNGVKYTIPNIQEVHRKHLTSLLHRYHDKNESLYRPICELFYEELKLAAAKGKPFATRVVSTNGSENIDDLFYYICLEFPPDLGYRCQRYSDHSLCDCDYNGGRGCTTYVTVNIL